MVYLLKQDKTRQTFAGPRLNVMPEQASLHYDVYKKRTSLPFTCLQCMAKNDGIEDSAIF